MNGCPPRARRAPAGARACGLLALGLRSACGLPPPELPPATPLQVYRPEEVRDCRLSVAVARSAKKS